jgi:hypothetical protein
LNATSCVQSTYLFNVTFGGQVSGNPVVDHLLTSILVVPVHLTLLRRRLYVRTHTVGEIIPWNFSGLLTQC